MGRRVRACVPCHERKVRCDAVKVGTPCTRCVDNGRTQGCVMLNGLSRRRNHQATADTAPVQGDRSSQSSTDQPAASLLLFTDRPQAQLDRHSPCILSPIQGGRSLSDDSTLHVPGPLEAPRHNDSHSEDHPQLLQDGQHAFGQQEFQFIYEQPPLTDPDSGHEPDDVSALHDGTNSMTILTEALGSATSCQIAYNLPVNGNMSVADEEFLHRKGAFTLPQQHICDQLLCLFFDKVYMSVPVIDRVMFVQDYWQQTQSMFVLQAILASAVPHATIDLLNKAGFSDHAAAQEMFFTRAKLLHDLDAEQSLLHRLQGSLILAVTHVSHYMQRDHRNTSRQSTGISPKLLRRLWAVIYTWDVLLALNGMNTMRQFHNIDSTPLQLTELDWEEDPDPKFHSLLQPVSSQEKLYLIMSCKLSLIISEFWDMMLYSPADVSCEKLEVAFSSWRQAFPPGVQVISINQSSTVNSWHLTLVARGYVCQCVLYRMVARRFGPGAKSANTGLHRLASQKLRATLFELDTTIDRIMNQNSGQFNTWLFHTCISTAVALHIERYIDPATSPFEGMLAILRIQAGLQFLREMAKSWSYIGSFVTMFEGVINTVGLPIPLPNQRIATNDPLPSPTSFERLQLPGRGVVMDSNSWLPNTEACAPIGLPSGPFNANSILDELFDTIPTSLDI
ncbi:hypothetical protein CNMCM6805_005869 [Aspergillus fumigatiaffinis]|uniref:Zn(2)-C6 fungal-type domain-containing protein n=1 Tax=Aspergillus fumigatiaffinis TaxID=340414 RepID=A0A8H4H5P2_9EURO|nr:hypothetical protein CNMCM6457_002368 [Aspergillus fumigatiaffinis]KAF4239447.1 hypothetical protein CNMCM6805_005869 [Aspergillus fumigatiaffinis]